MKQIFCLDAYGKEHAFDESAYRERTAAYGIYIKDNQLLLIQDTWSKLWELPGGGLEEGEGIEQGLQREFKEETGLTIAGEMTFITKYSNYFLSTQIKEPWHATRIFYKVSVVDGELLKGSNGDDVIQAKFYTLDSLKHVAMNEKIREIILQMKEQL